MGSKTIRLFALTGSLSLLPVIALFLLALPGTALALPASVDMHFLAPAHLDLGPRQAVAVHGFQGWRAADIEDAVLQALQDDSRGLEDNSKLRAIDPIVAKPDHFPVLDRTQIDGVLGEGQAIEDALADETVLAALNELAAGCVLITGTITGPSVTDTWEDKEVERTKPMIGKVMETDHKLVRTVRIDFKMRAFDMQTGELRASQAFDISLKVEGQFERDRKLAKEHAPDAMAKAAELIGPLGYRIVNYVAPRWRSRSLSVERNKHSADGVDLLKKEDDLAGATGWFVRTAGESPYDEWAQFNAAVLLGATYHFEDAERHLAAARGVKDRPRFRSFAKTLAGIQEDFDALSASGIPLAPIPYDEAGAAAAASDTVVVKGNRKKMVALLSEPGGATVVQVPGGMTLDLLESKDGWHKVRTYDGKEGWIAEDSVK